MMAWTPGDYADYEAERAQREAAETVPESIGIDRLHEPEPNPEPAFDAGQCPTCRGRRIIGDHSSRHPEDWWDDSCPQCGETGLVTP